MKLLWCLTSTTTFDHPSFLEIGRVASFSVFAIMLNELCATPSQKFNKYSPTFSTARHANRFGGFLGGMSKILSNHLFDYLHLLVRKKVKFSQSIYISVFYYVLFTWNYHYVIGVQRGKIHPTLPKSVTFEVHRFRINVE